MIWRLGFVAAVLALLGLSSAISQQVNITYAAVATTGSASDLGSGTLAAARGGAGTINGALKGNGSGTVSQAACADISNATGLCSATYTSATSWTPVDSSGASLTFTSVSANYTRAGNMVFAYAALTYPSTANGSVAVIGGLPIVIASAEYGRQCSLSMSTIATVTKMLPVGQGLATVQPLSATGGTITNAVMSTGIFYFICSYPVS